LTRTSHRYTPEPPIYLDHNATTPIDAAVAEAMLPFLYEHFGNPSSTHAFGKAARKAVERARAKVAALIDARPEEILFTSGGTESNNMVLRGMLASMAPGVNGCARHIITSQIEHPAILEPCRHLEDRGCRVTRVGVDALGRVDPQEIERAVTPETRLISIMHANNEVGTLQPIERIAAIARRHAIHLHTDAAQSVGKVPVLVDKLGIDFLSIAGHKLYAPKGIGALYIRSGRNLPSLILGADHESGRRAGTENVLEIVGLGEACAMARETLHEGALHSSDLRDRLWQLLESDLVDVRRNGDPEHCLPNTLSVGFRGIDASALLARIGDRVAASAGAACHAEGVTVSSVLEAMQVPLEYAMGTVRFSGGRRTTARDIDRAANIVLAAVQELTASAASR